jgi:hypothetical protein
VAALDIFGLIDNHSPCLFFFFFFFFLGLGHFLSARAFSCPLPRKQAVASRRDVFLYWYIEGMISLGQWVLQYNLNTAMGRGFSESSN